MATVAFKVYPTPEGKKASIFAVLRISQAIRPEINTGERVFAKHWGAGRVKGGPDKVEINLHLNQIEKNLLQIWRENSTADKATITDLARKAIRGDAAVQKKTLFHALELFLNECESGKGRNTFKMYRSLQTKLTDFNERYPIDFNNLDFNFYDAFKRYLYLVPNPAYPNHCLAGDSDGDSFRIVHTSGARGTIGLFDDTVYKYFTNLKAFLAWATDRGYPVDKPFEKWEIIKRSYPPISLSKEELDRLESAQLTGTLAIARDFLALECRTGARISDLQRFDIKQANDRVWTYIPKKTARLHAKEVKLPFVGYTAPAWWILQRYNFKMPAIAEQTINRNIKEACRLAGIDSEISITRWVGSKKVIIPGKKYEYITTHTGKKTFITILAENNVPLKVISDLSGTSVQTIIKHYLGKSDSKVIDNYLNQVETSQSIMRKAN